MAGTGIPVSVAGKLGKGGAKGAMGAAAADAGVMAALGGTAGIIAAGITFVGSVLEGLFSRPAKTYQEKLTEAHVAKLQGVARDRMQMQSNPVSQFANNAPGLMKKGIDPAVVQGMADSLYAGTVKQKQLEDEDPQKKMSPGGTYTG